MVEIKENLENKNNLSTKELSNADNISSVNEVNVDQSIDEVKVDNNNRCIINAHNYNKIIFMLMIKNESKIIERCIENALPHVDAISILDTGSTDDTVKVCKNYLEKCGKPYKISVKPFKNFGYNRTFSFKKTQELCNELKWDADKTYALALDADMILCSSEKFKNVEMTRPGYSIIQKNGNLTYYNIRFLKCGFNWKCEGVTHEYWSGDPRGNIEEDIIYINDVNDGGCKADKFTRDIRLLTEDLKKDPKNQRSYFYLAQSYMNIGKFEESIKSYKKRIELGGWEEEVWYSHYQIGKCHLGLNNVIKAEEWMLKAWERRKHRAEPIYILVNYFRLTSQHYKAYYYYLLGKDISFPKQDVLFIEHDVYKGLFDYENTILAYYINNQYKVKSLNQLVEYINKKIHYNVNNVWDNMFYYIEALDSSIYKGEYSRLFFPEHNEYQASSCSIISYKDKLVMNVRYVNYSIDEYGAYHMRSTDGKVRTKNGIVYLNSKCYPNSEVVMLEENIKNTFPSNIEGLEDIRLFNFNGKLKCTASSKNITNNDAIVIGIGDYNIDNNKISNINPIEPPQPSGCEKNWIFVPNSALQHKDSKNKMNFIYGWHPLTIGAIDSNNKLNIHTKYDTPELFSRFRGSSSLCEYDGKLWGVVHFVRYSTPRVYYHSLVQFNRYIMKPEKYSLPFCFRKLAIEYCLGLHINGNIAYFVFSQNDNSPGHISVPLNNLQFIDC